MATITLARALKEKARMANQLNKLIGRLAYNSYLKGNDPTYNTVDVLTEIETQTKKLVDLKVAIALANKPIQSIIFKMSENKSLISHLNGLDTTEGKTRASRYSSEGAADEYAAQITIKKKDEMISDLEKNIADQQEQLDTHNASTRIEVNL